MGRCWFKSLTKNKSIEIELINNDCTIFGFICELTRKQDHAGFYLIVTVLCKELIIRIYDNRHWDYKNNRWKE